MISAAPIVIDGLKPGPPAVAEACQEVVTAVRPLPTTPTASQADRRNDPANYTTCNAIRR